MAVSSDVILTTRSHSTADLRTNGSAAAADATPRDADSNVAACYGVDTVHSWATVSAGTALSGWRSDAQLYTGGDSSWTAVSSDASPPDDKPRQRSDEPSATCGDGEPASSTRTEAAADSAGLVNGIDPVEAPQAPPRSKRKARPALVATVDSSIVADGGLL